MLRHVPGRGAIADHIVVMARVGLKSLADSVQELVDATIAARRSGRGNHAMDYGEVEVTIAERTAAMERAAHTKKTLVEIRMKRAGSRWKTETREHILRLRARAERPLGSPYDRVPRKTTHCCQACGMNAEFLNSGSTPMGRV